MPTALEGKLPTDYSNNYFPKAGRAPENTTSAGNSISAKEQMLSNYLQHQEWSCFSEYLYKSSQGPVYEITEKPGSELPKEKTKY